MKVEQGLQVSIIVPIYNGEKYIESCLRALVNQTLERYEIVCVNDGSTDNSKEILERYVMKYPDKVRVIHIDNSGVWFARKLGIQTASGKYLGFCDCDDRPNENMYLRLYEQAEKEGAEMAVCAYERVEAKTEKRYNVEMQGFGKRTLIVAEELGNLAVVNTAMWNKMILREVAIKHVQLEQPPRIAEDMMFLTSLYPHIKRITFVDECLYTYYVQENSAMSHIKEREVEHLLQNMKAVKKFVNQQSSNHRWNDLLAMIAFIHIGVSLPLQFVKSKKKIPYLQGRIKRYLNQEFPEWKNNRYLKLTYVIKCKGILWKPMVMVWAYKLGLFRVVLWFYYQLRDKLKIDIKW